MKRILLLVTISVAVAAGVGMADEQLDKSKDLKLSLDMTYATQYIWRGFDLFKSKGAFQPSINVDLYGSGFSFNVWSAQPIGSGNENAKEIDYTVKYANSLAKGERLQTDWAVSWVYYDVYDNASKNADGSEFNVAFDWPKIFGGGLSPHYMFAYYYPPKGGGDVQCCTGFFHIMGLSYALPTPDLIPNNPDQAITFGWDITYNDGACGKVGSPVDSDWSHMVWSVKTSFDIGPGYFTPALYWQNSMEDTVNDDDELWATLSYTIDF